MRRCRHHGAEGPTRRPETLDWSRSTGRAVLEWAKQSKAKVARKGSACSLRLAAAAIRLRLRLLQYFSLYGLQLQQSKQLQQCRLVASRTCPVSSGTSSSCFFLPSLVPPLFYSLRLSATVTPKFFPLYHFFGSHHQHSTPYFFISRSGSP